MDPMSDLQEPDESRPAKRVRLDAPLQITEELKEEVIDDDDWDDVYATGLDGTAEPKPGSGTGTF